MMLELSKLLINLINQPIDRDFKVKIVMRQRHEIRSTFKFIHRLKLQKNVKRVNRSLKKQFFISILDAVELFKEDIGGDLRLTPR